MSGVWKMCVDTSRLFLGVVAGNCFFNCFVLFLSFIGEGGDV